MSTQSDRELLELAAKAAGIQLDWQTGWNGMPDLASNNGKIWNPLTDDGDALRMAVMLKLNIEIYDDNAEVFWYLSDANGEHDGSNVELFRSLDMFAATRRAIVVAAAEIGRQS